MIAVYLKKEEEVNSTRSRDGGDSSVRGGHSELPPSIFCPDQASLRSASPLINHARVRATFEFQSWLTNSTAKGKRSLMPTLQNKQFHSCCFSLPSMRSLVLLSYVPLWYKFCAVEWSQQIASKIEKVPVVFHRQVLHSNSSSLVGTHRSQKCAISAHRVTREIYNITTCHKNRNPCGGTDTSLLMSMQDRNEGSLMDINGASLRHGKMPVMIVPTGLDFFLEHNSVIVMSEAFDTVWPRASLINTTSWRILQPSKLGISSFMNGTRQGCPLLKICEYLAGTRATSNLVFRLSRAVSVAVLVVIVSCFVMSCAVTVRSYLYLKCSPTLGPEIEGRGEHGDSLLTPA